MKKTVALFFALTLIVGLCACTASKAEDPADPTADASQGPTWQEQYDLGVRYLSEGNYEEAILAFTAAIEIDPKRAPAYVGRGDAYVGSGETEANLVAAKADYEKGIELDKTSAEAYLGLADVYIRQGEYEKALEVLKQGLEKTEHNQKIADKIAEIEKGTVKDLSGKIRRVSFHDAQGAMIWYYTCDYGPDGVRTTVTSFDGQGNQTCRIDESYDENGHMLRGLEGYSPSTGDVYIGVYQYDEAGNCTRVDSYDMKNELSTYTTFEYCPDGVSRENNYDSRGNLTGYTQFDYENGKNVKYSDYGSNGELYGYTSIEYNADGNQVKQTHYSADHVMGGYEIFNWNEEGKIPSVDFYDANGNLLASENRD